MAKTKLLLSPNLYEMTYTYNNLRYGKEYSLQATGQKFSPVLSNMLNNDKIELCLNFDEKKDRRKKTTSWPNSDANFTLSELFNPQDAVKADFSFVQSPKSQTFFDFYGGYDYYQKNRTRPTANFNFIGAVNNISIRDAMGFKNINFIDNNVVKYTGYSDVYSDQLKNQNISITDRYDIKSISLCSKRHRGKISRIDAQELEKLTLEYPALTITFSYSSHLPKLKELDLSKVDFIKIADLDIYLYSWDFNFQNYQSTDDRKSDRVERDFLDLSSKINLNCKIKLNPESTICWKKLKQKNNDAIASKYNELSWEKSHNWKVKDLFPNKNENPIITTPLEILKYFYEQRLDYAKKQKKIVLEQAHAALTSLKSSKTKDRESKLVDNIKTK